MGLLSIFNEKSLPFIVIPACPVCVFAEGVCHSDSNLISVIPIDVGQGSLQQKGQEAALNCYLHVRNKLTGVGCAHRECFGWVP